MHYIKQQHIKDLIYILIFSILMLLLLLKVNAFDLLIKYTRAHEEYQLDEVILLVLISSFSFIWFSLRRLKELKILKDKLSVQNNNLEEKIKSEGITPNIPLSEWVKLEGRDKIILSRIETQSNPR